MTDIICCICPQTGHEDGKQVDYLHTAAEAGIRFPVFLTRRVFDAYVSVPNVGLSGRSRIVWTLFRCSALTAKRSARC